MKTILKISGLTLFYFVLLYILKGFNLKNPFFDSTYFSTTFLFGLIGKPISLFITTIFGLLLLNLLNNKELFPLIKKQTEKFWVKSIIFIVVAFFFIILLRLFGATLKSIIFDSKYQLFNTSFNLLDFFNIAFILNLLGISFFFTFLLIKTANFSKKIFTSEKSFFVGIAFFITLLVFNILIEKFFPLHEINIFSKFLISLLIIILVFGFGKTSKLIFSTLFLSSFISLLILNEHNSAKDYKIFTALSHKLVRPNNFYLKAIIQNDLEDFVNQQINAENLGNNSAFKIWENSLFHLESIGNYILVYKNGQILSYFENNFQLSETERKADFQLNSNIIKVEKFFSFDRNEFQIVVFANNSIENIFNSTSADFFKNLSSFQNKIFDFSQISLMIEENNKITFLSDNFPFSEESQLSKSSKNTSFSNGNYSIVKVFGNNSKIYTFIKRNDNLTEFVFKNLKIFFIHLVAIFLIYLILSLISLKKSTIIFNFKFVLVLSVILITTLPLVFLGFYLRDFAEKKNFDAIEFKLRKRANQVKNYILSDSKNVSLSTEKLNEIHKNLGINFSIYNSSYCIYSTYEEFYTNGILDENLQKNLSLAENQKIIKNKIYQTTIYHKIYHSFVAEIVLGGRKYFIEINSAFNPITMSISATDLDMALISTYSITGFIIILMAIFLVNKITSPILRLSEATKKMSTGDFDIQIESQSFGELKELTNNFNQMAKQLGTAQKQIIQMEREATWQEMARQVAHEIKNPLTPMKLAIQQLIAVKSDNSPKYEEYFEKITSTLLKQIEILSKIADEFSAFAKMPSVKVQVVNLSQILKDVENLYSDISITFENLESDLFVASDKEYLSRVFINLIKNAKESEAKKIIISIERKIEYTFVRIWNNGKKIDNENFNKIFNKNFSTKEKGMGLGLFLSKQFLQNTGSDILLVDSNDNGTIFEVKLKNE